MCQSCLEKLSEAMEVKCEEGKEPEPVDLVLIDFETMELYSVQEQYTKRVSEITPCGWHIRRIRWRSMQFIHRFAQRQEKMRV